MNFWIFQDKPNKRIAIHRAECGTRNVGQGPPSEGRSWHGPYSNYDEAFGKVNVPRLPCGIFASAKGL